VVDLVLSASPEFFTDKKKTKEWEQATQQWAEDTFGKENIIYSVVHYDEKTPHFHIALVPIFEGKLRASHWFDGPAKLKKIHDSYARVTKKL
ncbi:plasmid recombination protein, partial [Escherichia coli]|nr:plasmid recombination protein [Escherichia coli]